MDVACLAPSDAFDYTQIFEDICRTRVDPDISFEDYAAHTGEIPDSTEYDAVMISGSGAHVYDRQDWVEATEAYVEQAVDDDVPVLGVCYGHQLLADTYDGTVEQMDEREMGYNTVHLTAAGENHALFEDLPDSFTTFTSHMDHVAEPPTDATVLAENEYGIHAFQLDDEPVYGIQFHPEYSLDMAQELLDGKELDDDTYDTIAATLTVENAETSKESRSVFENFLEQL